MGPFYLLLISDEKDDIPFTFDVIMLDLKGKPWDVENIDPDGAEKVSGNLLRVRKLASSRRSASTDTTPITGDTKHGAPPPPWSGRAPVTRLG